MKDEIKEILEIFKNITNDYSTNSIFDFEDYEITCLQVKSLLDYITNLQEENEDLREENKEAYDFDETMKDIKENLIARINRQEYEIHNLQQRVDKAVEYLDINEEILETCGIYDVNGIEVYKILQGGDK